MSFDMGLIDATTNLYGVVYLWLLCKGVACSPSPDSVCERMYNFNVMVSRLISPLSVATVYWFFLIWANISPGPVQTP